MDQEQRAWATGRLLDLAEHLTTSGREIAALRAGGGVDARAAVLYPFDLRAWAGGIRELTLAAEHAPGEADLPLTALSAEQAAVRILQNSWESTSELAATLDRRWRTLAMAEAWANAVDERMPELTPHVLTFTVLLLAALARDEAHPAELTFERYCWDTALPGYRTAVNSLAALLAERNWSCAS